MASQSQCNPPAQQHDDHRHDHGQFAAHYKQVPPAHPTKWLETLANVRANVRSRYKVNTMYEPSLLMVCAAELADEFQTLWSQHCQNVIQTLWSQHCQNGQIEKEGTPHVLGEMQQELQVWSAAADKARAAFQTDAVGTQGYVQIRAMFKHCVSQASSVFTKSADKWE